MMNYTKGLISIIVPVYNTEKYLNRCIESIVKQTYSNIEIIIVDDGSNDGSKVICDDWMLRDDRICVIHKKNGGLSSARNAGLKLARGEYVGFVDSDDYVENDMYESLLLNMEGNIDIACCARKLIYPPNMRKQPMYWCALNKRTVFSNEEAIREVLLLRYISFSVCTKLFRRSLLENMWFLDGKISEDLPFTYEALKKSRNVVHIGKAKYNNTHREDSISRKPFYIGRINSVQFAKDILLDVLKEYPKLKPEAEVMYIKNLYRMNMNIEQSDNSNKYIKLRGKIKKELWRMYIRNIRNPYIPEYLKRYILKSCLWERILTMILIRR